MMRSSTMCMPADRLSREEWGNVVTHGCMVLVFLVWMLFGVPDAWQKQPLYGFGILVFFLCMIAMFSASTLYHAMTPGTRAKEIFHVLDRLEIRQISDFNSMGWRQGLNGIRELGSMSARDRKFLMDVIGFLWTQSKSVFLRPHAG